jgi:hypothetical protein
MPPENDIVNAVLNSREFKDSPVYRNLLSYLVNASFSKNIPKETTIAIDVFGKDPTFNSNKDSSVRYHIHTLRKKIDDYYRNEGKSEKIRLYIPVGHYEIKFVASDNPAFSGARRLREFFFRWEIFAVLALVGLSGFLASLQFRQSRSSPFSRASGLVDSDDPVWGPFFGNGYPISIILGDDFLMDEYNPEFGRYRQIRDWKIDSENDLNGFLIRYPKARLWKSEITDVPFGGIRNLADLLPVAYRFQNDVSLGLSSTLSLDDLRGRNLVYVGEFKNLRVLNKILFNTPVRFQYRPDERVFLLGSGNDTLETFHRIEAPYDQLNKYNVDYSLLIKMPGFADENFMFVVGFGYGGRIERTKMLGNPDLRRKFVDEIIRRNKSVPKFFIALFEVQSIERTGFSNQLKVFREIPAGR